MDKETYQETVERQIRDKQPSLVCRVCGEDNPAVIDMHHVEGRSNSDWVEPLCKNCHSKITEVQNKTVPKKRSKKANPIEKKGFQLISIGGLLKLVGDVLIKYGHELMNHD